MEAQHLFDLRRQRVDVDLANVPQIMDCDRIDDRLCLIPKPQGEGQAARLILMEALNQRPLPVGQELERLLLGQPFDIAQPIEAIAVGAAREAVEVVVVDMEARRAVIVIGTVGLAIDQRLSNQLGKGNVGWLGLCFVGVRAECFARLRNKRRRCFFCWGGAGGGFLRSGISLGITEPGPNLGGDWQTLSPVRQLRQETVKFLPAAETFGHLAKDLVVHMEHARIAGVLEALHRGRQEDHERPPAPRFP